MSRSFFASAKVLATVALMICESQIYAADPYAGSKILPKVECLSIRCDDETLTTEGDFSWPATVAKTEGQWLLIIDDGRSRTDGRPSRGWVRKSHVILMGKDPLERQFLTATDYYTAQIVKAKSGQGDLSKPRMFWLRGVAWQDQGNIDAAHDDYVCAIKCPEICYSSYEDEAYSGLADCLASQMVRDNSAIFACRHGIDLFRKECECVSPVPGASGRAATSSCGQCEISGSLDGTRFDEKKDWKRAAQKAADSMQKVSMNFLIAISLKARPRTYAVWADDLLVSNVHDIPYFGFFVLHANLNGCKFEEILKRSTPARVSSEQLQRTRNDICTSLGDVVRCDCPPGCTSGCLPHTIDLGDVTIPFLCGHALAKCPSLENAYNCRSRFYKAAAQEAMSPYTKQVVAWRNSRNAALKSLADQQAADKSQLDKLRSYRHVLEEDLSLIQRLNSDRLSALKTDLTLDLRSTLIATSADASKGLSGMSNSAAGPSFEKTLALFQTAAPLLVDFEDLVRDRDDIKRCLRRLQFERDDVRCSPKMTDCESRGAVCIDPGDPNPVDMNRLKAAIAFYDYWRLALRDADEAIVVSSTKTRTDSLNTAYRLRASLLLMRLSPTGLQPVERYPNQLRTSVVDVLSQLLPADLIQLLKNIKVEADEVQAFRLIVTKLKDRFVERVLMEFQKEDVQRFLPPGRSSPQSLEDVIAILDDLKCCPGENSELKKLIHERTKALIDQFNRFLGNEAKNFHATTLKETRLEVIRNALLGIQGANDNIQTRFVKNSVEQSSEWAARLLIRILEPDPLTKSPDTVEAVETLKDFLTREVGKVNTFVTNERVDRWQAEIQSRSRNFKESLPKLFSLENAMIEPLVRNLPKWSRAASMFADEFAVRSDDQRLVDVLDLLFGLTSHADIASRLTGSEICDAHPELLQDSQLASQAEAAAAQAVKLSQYKGKEGLTLWGASLAATADYSSAIRRLSTAVGLLSVDQQPQVTALMQAICAAKQASDKTDFSCSSSGASTPTSATCKPCNVDVRLIAP